MISEPGKWQDVLLYKEDGETLMNELQHLVGKCEYERISMILEMPETATFIEAAKLGTENMLPESGRHWPSARQRGGGWRRRCGMEICRSA